jgi:hypothetical protein
MNILIKLMSIVSLVIAPTLAQINAKKVETPPTPPVRMQQPSGKILNLQSEPMALLNKKNTVLYTL